MYEELKIVAELAKSGGFEIGSAYSEDRYYAFDEIAYIDFAEKATPSAVLALIAENERLGLKADSLEFAKWSCQVNQAAIRLAGHETIEDLQAERDQLKAENEAMRDSLCRLNSGIDAMAAENETLRKDAERYRWMRDKAPRLWIQTPLIAMCSANGSICYRDHGLEMLLSGADADSAIDQAMMMGSSQ